MTNFVSRLLNRSAPSISEARPVDAPAIAAIHSASFQRGWGEDEIQRLLLERNVVSHRITAGGKPSAGNSFNRSAPWASAANASVGVATPGAYALVLGVTGLSGALVLVNLLPLVFDLGADAQFGACTGLAAVPVQAAAVQDRRRGRISERTGRRLVTHPTRPTC